MSTPKLKAQDFEGMGGLQLTMLLGLFFLSGAAALIYEVLWLKELGRLFGVTAHAAATTLAVFFLGLAAGGWVWGTRSARARNPLRTYGLLELAIAVSALLYFLILAAYHSVYGLLFNAFGDQPTLLLGVKFALSLGILFPPAFFMGGTLPVMGQYLVRKRDQLGLKASLLYTVNTFGAATGAFLAGFYLPPALGFRKSYLVAILLNVLIGLVALWWSRSDRWIAPAHAVVPTPLEDRAQDSPTLSPAAVWTAAIVSGFATLGLEVLWVRMYAQVLQNSVYTFSATLTVFLVALALGSGVANLLCRSSLRPPVVLFWLVILAGFLVGMTPFVFYRLTSGLELLGPEMGWSGYIVSVFGLVFLVLLIPVAVIGTVFPFLMKLSESWMRSAGRTIGRLAAANTAAAIIGSLAAGFFLLERIGLWASIRLMAMVYFVLALVVAFVAMRSQRYLTVIPLLGLALFAGFLTYSNYGVVHVDSESEEEILQVWEGSHGTVAVIRQGGVLRTKLNNSYTLGASNAALLLRRQAWVPLSVHPKPSSVFFLGMGTGISAGGSLDFPVDRVVVTELSADIVEASRLHFAPFLNGLFDDERVQIVREDGRNFLFGVNEQFDVVIADLFLTEKSGVGDLYTREHYERVRSRLSPGGLFAQWLPMGYLTEVEFAIIARTMLEVFPRITVWRRGFSMPTPAIALIGETAARPLDVAAFREDMESLRLFGKMKRTDAVGRAPLALYAGDLATVKSEFAMSPVNTDDQPLVEYLAPITHRDSASLSRSQLIDFFAALLRGLPPQDDPYLSELSPEKIKQVYAGFELTSFLVARDDGSARSAEIHLKRFQELTGIGLLFQP
jgi:spermidine synthase